MYAGVRIKVKNISDIVLLRQLKQHIPIVAKEQSFPICDLIPPQEQKRPEYS